MRRVPLLCALAVMAAIFATGRAQSPANTQPFESAWTAGEAARSQGEWPLAIAHYRDALKINPQHAQARFYLALAYRETARYYEARRNFRLALNAHSADRAWVSQCRLEIAACWEATHQYREALAEYQLALAANGSAEAEQGQRRTLALLHSPTDHSK